jgi:hypothetical protein
MVLVLCKRLNAEIKENKQVCLIKKTRNYIRRPKRLGTSDKQIIMQQRPVCNSVR